jgi:peroxiredoxin
MALLALLGAAWIAANRADQEVQQGGPPTTALPREGYMAPDWALESLAGEHFALADLRGQVVILNFWATWCPPCRSEMPAIEQVYRTYLDQGLTVMAVNAGEAEQQTKAFVEEMGLTFPVLPDRDGHVSRVYRVTSLPTTFFVDRTGTIREIAVGGPLSRAYIASAIEPLLEEGGTD